MPLPNLTVREVVALSLAATAALALLVLLRPRYTARDRAIVLVCVASNAIWYALVR